MKGPGTAKDVKGEAADDSLQPFSWKAIVIFVGTCSALVWYFENEKARMQRKRIAEASKGVGRPKVGGEFALVDQNGNTFTSDMMKGNYSLVRSPGSTLSLGLD